MAEAATQYVVQFEEGFPRAEVEALGVELMAAGILAPGFIPPSAGLLRLEAIVYAKDEQGYAVRCRGSQWGVCRPRVYGRRQERVDPALPDLVQLH